VTTTPIQASVRVESLPPLPQPDGYAAISGGGTIIVPPCDFAKHNAYAVFTVAQMREYATAALAAKEAEVARLREALEEVQRVLAQANGTPDGPIVDTIWRGPAETLFDYIDATINPTQGETK